MPTLYALALPPAADPGVAWIPFSISRPSVSPEEFVRLTIYRRTLSRNANNVTALPSRASPNICSPPFLVSASVSLLPGAISLLRLSSAHLDHPGYVTC